MARRTAVLLLGCLGLFAAGSAGAQTTSTTSSTSSTTTSSTSSTLVLPSTSSTTSTTEVNPCTGKPCTAEAPAAFLSGAAGEARLDMGNSCWLDPVPTAQGLVRHCIVDVRADPGATLAVQAGETLSLRFGIAMAPTRASITVEDQSTNTPLAAANPTTFTADFTPGSHTVSFITSWLQGDATYRVKLDVRAATPPPATPRTGPISLTG